ncbi:hypothetical protein EXIGLDRAFT_718983 [Exidia glandulosa HHB12029]|uniref:Glycosyltransferase family 2 protein n=1 Tax=Exidia glandulosa HHB12029 TaxID=1314781 RepID=A0A165NUH2_EXIGL|nr:hypothetical protein EXIGLDRAFT_718983 [Exidia glandulosa HHB12029]
MLSSSRSRKDRGSRSGSGLLARVAAVSTSNGSAQPTVSARVWYIFLGLCFVAVLRQYALQPSASLESPVVTLASTKYRVSHELPGALRSLLHQSLPPRQILIHVPVDDQEAFNSAVSALPSPLRRMFDHPNVAVRFTPDLGPATKLIPALSAMLDAREYATPLVVLDDDHLYHPRLLESLVRAHNAAGRTAAVGTRGWRVRQDLRWGVVSDEYDYHVHLGWFLAKPYQVGVLTANDAYLVLPSFFRASACADQGEEAHEPPARPAVLDPSDSGNPEAAHLVDDIWINGQLARNCVPRYIVPVPGANIDITRTHVLESHMRNDGISRARANDVMLRFFKDAWEREGIWYEFGGKGQPSKKFLLSQWLVTWEKGWRWLWGR